ERAITVLPLRGAAVDVTTERGTREAASGLEGGGAPFYPFGEEAASGSRMTIRFQEPLPAGERISFWVQLAPADDGVETIRIPSGYEAFVPSGRTEWQYWAEEEDGTAGWKPLPLDCD